MGEEGGCLRSKKANRASAAGGNYRDSHRLIRGVLAALAAHDSAFGHDDAADASSASVPSLQSYNRSVSLGASILEREYVENDSQGLTSDGVLDSEKGTLAGAAVRVRWQGLSWPGNCPAALIQGIYQQFSGSTAYRGYLQSGGTLIPDEATTGNRRQALALRGGWSISRTEELQWLPFIEYRYQQWQRDLVQYRETFQHEAALVGLMGQWRVSPAWTLEGEIGAGTTLRARMDAPAFGFSERLPNRVLWTMGASATYRFDDYWWATGSIHHERFHYGQSAISNGLLEPASRTRQTHGLVGVDYQF
jgi:hypothetical protein